MMTEAKKSGAWDTHLLEKVSDSSGTILCIRLGLSRGRRRARRAMRSCSWGMGGRRCVGHDRCSGDKVRRSVFQNARDDRHNGAHKVPVVNFGCVNLLSRHLHHFSHRCF